MLNSKHTQTDELELSRKYVEVYQSIHNLCETLNIHKQMN